MEIKILILLLIFCGSSQGQSISCEYRETSRNDVYFYGCDLTIENPSGFDNFTSINGTHLEGRTDADVTLIVRRSGSTVIFPKILCSQFPNLTDVELMGFGVVQINEDTFSQCVNVRKFWLNSNRIEEVHERAFVNNTKLKIINLYMNRIISLSENIFDNLVSLEELEISYNPLTNIPAGLFRNLINLKSLALMSLNINAINPEWFANLTNLEMLSLHGNNITTLSEDTFANMKNLWSLHISSNPIGDNLPGGIFRELKNLVGLGIDMIGMTQINTAWFESLSSLKYLYMSLNFLTSIPEGAFDNFSNLIFLDMVRNRLTDSGIPANLFDNCQQLSTLLVYMNNIQTLNPQWFQRLTKMEVLKIGANQINELPAGIFAQFENLREIDLQGTNLKTINRDAFGNIGNLSNANFQYNVINAIDERFLNEAWPLTTLDLTGNLCTSERFSMFGQNRDIFMPRLSTCTNNFRWIIEIATEQGEAYRFYNAPYPGVQVRVNTDEEIRIALTPFNFFWNPVVEIVIGTSNNTLSTIIRDQDTQVVVARSPNIIRPGQWTGLRVTWSNHLVLVTREGQSFPFLGYNLESIFPVQFYGIRSPESHAVWSIQPVEAEILPTED